MAAWWPLRVSFYDPPMWGNRIRCWHVSRPTPPLHCTDRDVVGETATLGGKDVLKAILGEIYWGGTCTGREGCVLGSERCTGRMRWEGRMTHESEAWCNSRGTCNSSRGTCNSSRACMHVLVCVVGEKGDGVLWCAQLFPFAFFKSFFLGVSTQFAFQYCFHVFAYCFHVFTYCFYVFAKYTFDVQHSVPIIRQQLL